MFSLRRNPTCQVYRLAQLIINGKHTFLQGIAVIPSRNPPCRNKVSKTSKLFEDTRVTKDVLLFKYENQRFFSILNFFALSQFMFWSYLAHFSYTTLRDISKEDAEKQLKENMRLTSDNVESISLVWWRRINLGENKYRYGITLLCLSIGYIILVGAVLFTKRTVRYLTLLKGGQHVQLICYSPFWRPRLITVPLEHMTCNVSRDHIRGHLPIKIKNYWMYFLLDKSGTFTNTQLFDYTAGLKRSWAKKL